MGVITPIGERAIVARGSVATAFVFRHGTAPHRDPVEERFDRPTLILTAAGTWHVASASVSGLAGPAVAVLAGRATAYRCRHDGRRPTDRTLAITFHDARLLDASGGIEALLPAGRLALAPLTPALEPSRAALVAATHGGGPYAGLAFDLAALSFLVAAGGATTTAHSPSGIDLVLARLRADPLAEADLASLAAAAGLSPFHFARAFRARVGDSPVRHLRRLRLEWAAEALRDGDRTVTRIAHEAGYADAAHFATAFRRWFGCPPSAWRRTRAQRSTTAQDG